MKFIYVILASFLLLSCDGQPRVYYVDSILGSDNNDGKSPASAFQTLSKINNISLKSEDLVLLKRGSTFNDFFTISAKASKPIRVDAYGSGNDPVIDGQLNLETCILIKKSSNIIIKNIKVINFIGEGGLKIQYSNNIIIDSCEFYVTGHGGVFVETSKNCLVSNCNFSTPSDEYNKQTDGIYSQRNSNITYDHNYIVISNNHPDQHCDGIQTYEDTSTTIANNYIEQRNKKFSNSQGIYSTTAAGIHLYYNNVVYCPNSNASIIGFRNLEKGTGTVRVYNNTAVGNGINILYVSEDPYVEAKNNIFYSKSNSSLVHLNKELNDKGTINYNLYNKNAKQKVIHIDDNDASTPDINEAADRNSIFIVDLKLDNNFRPPKDSPAIDAGINLHGIVDFDRDGKKRPQGKGYDLGAYEIQ